MTRKPRSSPLVPEERRAALIAATLPLLRAEGLDVSTRKIAEAACVAEGTIFRVFPDKGALISATLAHAFDPMPVIESLTALADDPDLRFRLRTAMRIISQRFRENMPLLVVVRTAGAAGENLFPDARQGLRQIVDSLTMLILPDRDRLRLPPEKVAWLLVSMVMLPHRAETVTSEDVVAVLLDGVLLTSESESSKEIAC